MELLSLLGGKLLDYWSFVAISLVLATVGQVAKGVVWTEANFLRYRWTNPVMWRVIWWGRKTLPLHPLVVGGLLGLIHGLPVGPGIETTSARVLYFAFAGIASAWSFAVLKSLAKKQGIELPGDVEVTVESKREPAAGPDISPAEKPELTIGPGPKASK